MHFTKWSAEEEEERRERRGEGDSGTGMREGGVGKGKEGKSWLPLNEWSLPLSLPPPPKSHRGETRKMPPQTPPPPSKKRRGEKNSPTYVLCNAF